MIRKTISFIAIAVILSSCGNTAKKETAVKDEAPQEAVRVEFASLIENPENYIGKEISVQGKVVHVCTQSGKKMFITGENPDVRLFVSAGEEMPKFPMELLGSEIVVEGTLTRPEATAIAEEEGMKATAESVDIAKGDTCETEKALAAQPVLSELMMVYNKHTLVK
jgi:hypothetical protein